MIYQLVLIISGGGIPPNALRYYDDATESDGVKYYDDGVESSSYVEYIDV